MSKKKLTEEHYEELLKISKRKSENISLSLLDFLKKNKPPKTRTSDQNNALHKNFEIIANKLNEMGLPMQKVIRVDIEWDKDKVKKHLWKPVMIAYNGKESTTEIEKNSVEIEKIHKYIMKSLGETWGVPWHDFPHDPKKKKQLEEMMGAIPMTKIEYPKDELGEIPF